MKFLVCFDDRTEAKKTLKVAQEHAKIWQAELEVVNAKTRVEPLKHATVKKMEEKMEGEVKEILAGDDPTYEVQLLLTDLTPGEQLVKYAEDQNIEPAHKLKIDQNKLQNCRSNILNLVNVL